MAKKFADLKVAIVTDWLTNRGGGERVFLLFAEMFPQADIYTSVFRASTFPELSGRKVYVSHLQKSPLRNKHQLFAMMRPAVFESFDLDNYDLVISVTSAEAKGVLTKPETPHICYCHTPTRYYWSHYHGYLKEKQLGLLDPLVKLIMPSLVHRLRIWDRVAADRVDFFIANSRHTQKRIAKYYEAGSVVIYPPVNYQRFNIKASPEDFYLVVGRQVPYKRTDLVVEAFNQLGRPLKIIGTGSEIGRLKGLAKFRNIEFLGELTDEEVAQYFANCKALVFPQEEDFGIVPLEAMAAGKPVIAYGKGGAIETVIDKKTGLLFKEQTVDCLVDAVKRFEKLAILPSACRAQAKQFDQSVFRRRIKQFIEKAINKYHQAIKV